jgi:hypothetical protein
MPVSFSAFYWHPVGSTKKMASIAFRSSTQGRWHPRGCGLRVGSSTSRCAHNSSGIRQSQRLSRSRQSSARLPWERSVPYRTPSIQPTRIRSKPNQPGRSALHEPAYLGASADDYGRYPAAWLTRSHRPGTMQETIRIYRNLWLHAHRGNAPVRALDHSGEPLRGS